MNKKFMNIDNLKVVWMNISAKFAQKQYVESLEKRIEVLENKLKKLTAE